MSYNCITSKSNTYAAVIAQEFVKEATTVGPVAVSANLLLFGMYASGKALSEVVHGRYESGLRHAAIGTSCLVGSYFSFSYLLSNLHHPHTFANRQCYVWYDKDLNQTFSKECVSAVCIQRSLDNQLCMFWACSPRMPGVLGCPKAHQ